MWNVFKYNYLIFMNNDTIFEISSNLEMIDFVNYYICKYNDVQFIKLPTDEIININNISHIVREVTNDDKQNEI